ncbi:hypothetical protein GCM10023321_62320 [Pseudonocardia eucalypti]|uniref:Trp biosynthesis-associated membrane protein n=1 Tax=Pseudonocardia eucalypti TaxID=648755 RepID=A0ABP9QW78_9PSEU|nr:hypothetical protein [Pseudonocardia eucalypti]
MTPARRLGLTAAALGLGALGLWATGTLTWVRVAGRPAQVAADVRPELTPVALCVLASVAALVALGGWPRRVLGALLVVAGGWVVWLCADWLFGPPEFGWFAYAPLPTGPPAQPGQALGPPTVTAAPWLGAASGLLVAAAGVAVVWWASRMPRLGARYAAPGTAARVLDRDSAWWDAQDAGEDPTLNGSTGDPGQPPTNARG